MFNRLTDMNIYPINIKTGHFLEKYIFNKKKFLKSLYFFNLRLDSEQDPDPLFHATDPDPDQNETDPKHWKLSRIATLQKLSP